jgi:hypothetical protein
MDSKNILKKSLKSNTAAQCSLRLKKNPCKSVVELSIKCAPTSTPKTGNLKKSLLLFSHRVTRTGNCESGTLFTSNAQVRPTNGGRLSCPPVADFETL